MWPPVRGHKVNSMRSCRETTPSPPERPTWPDRSVTALHDLDLLSELSQRIRQNADDLASIKMLRLHAYAFRSLGVQEGRSLIVEVARAAEQMANRLTVNARLAPREFSRLDQKVETLRMQLLAHIRSVAGVSGVA